jgi:hypothetical protein
MVDKRVAEKQAKLLEKVLAEKQERLVNRMRLQPESFAAAARLLPKAGSANRGRSSAEVLSYASQ